MQKRLAVGLIVLGAVLCAWGVIAAVTSPEGFGGLSLTPQLALGIGWVLAGTFSLLIELRKNCGSDKR
jgi:hypothetical protein